ncbi:MAG: hypothetical protein IKA65_07970 [Lentisphaeria bacterium]|nr:hypothetical protein [Lentisphaeria bacterium]
MKKYLVRSFLLLSGLFLTTLGGCTGKEVSNDVLLTAAVECARTGNWQGCEDNALTVLKRDAVNTHALLLRSIASERLGKLDVAVDTARQAAENAPEDFAAQYNYGRLLAAKPDMAKSAIKVLLRALKLRPGNRNTLILLGQCSSRINADNAIEYYNALPPAVQKLPEIQTRKAIYYLDRRHRDRRNLGLALQALGNAYRAAPDNPGIVLNLAMFLDHYIGNKRKASAFYNRYLIRTEHNPELNPVRAQVKARISALR